MLESANSLGYYKHKKTYQTMKTKGKAIYLKKRVNNNTRETIGLACIIIPFILAVFSLVCLI